MAGSTGRQPGRRIEWGTLTPSVGLFVLGSRSSSVSTITAKVVSPARVSWGIIAFRRERLQPTVIILELRVERHELDQETPQHQAQLIRRRRTQQPSPVSLKIRKSVLSTDGASF